MRTTKEIITLIDKHKVVIYDYVTGREIEEIEDIFMEDSKEGEKSQVRRSAHKSIEMLVISVDDKPTKVLDRILDFKREDYRVIINAITDIVGGENEESKKKIEG